MRTGSTDAFGGGGIGVANAEDTTVSITYTTKSEIVDAAGVIAAGNAVVTANSAVDAGANSDASGLGFGADGHAQSNVYINNSPTTVEIGNSSALMGNTVRLAATVSNLQAHASSSAKGAGFYSEGIDHANVAVTAPLNVYIRGDAAVTGWEGVDLITRYDNVDTYADSFARSTGLFGYVHARASNNTDLHAQIVGELNAVVTAGARDPDNGALAHPAGFDNLTLYADTRNGTISVGGNGHVSRRSLAAGNGRETVNQNVSDKIDFSSDVNVLGPTLRLTIDAGGNITKAVGISVNSSVSATQTSGYIPDAVIHVNDVGNTYGSQVYFHSAGGDPTCADTGTICGSGGTWTFSDTLARILITNLSSKDLELNNMSTFNSTITPVVTLRAPVVTLTFTIRRTAGPTLVDI